MMKKRKTRRQRLAEKEATAKSLIDKANSLSNPLESLTVFHKYVTKDSQTIELSCIKATDAEPECTAWIFDIVERNMKTMYEQSSWGWDPVDKQKELTEPTVWYLVASSNNTFVGFSHFRFDIDDREEVLYCYEIQLESTVRRKGLGHFIMAALECMASENKMLKVVLTVFKHNLSAMQFFYSLGTFDIDHRINIHCRCTKLHSLNCGYKMDKTSPPASDQFDFIILSKAVDSGTMSKNLNSFQ